MPRYLTVAIASVFLAIGCAQPKANLLLQTLPVEQADFYCIQGLGPPAEPADKPAFCHSQRALLWPVGRFQHPFLFDESGGTGTGYDTLYVDFDANGDFLNDPIYKAVPAPRAEGPDRPTVLAYFPNVHIVENRPRDRYPHVQVFLEQSGASYNCCIIPQQWAVGTVTIDGKPTPAALIDRNWNDQVTDQAGLNLDEHPEKDPRGDYLVLAIDGEQTLVPGKESLGRGGSARGILTQYLVLNSGTYEVNAQQSPQGVNLRLVRTTLPAGTLALPSPSEDDRLLLVGTKTCVLIRNPSGRINLPADTYLALGRGNETFAIQEGQTFPTEQVAAAQGPTTTPALNVFEGRVVDGAQRTPVPQAKIAVASADNGSIFYQGPDNVRGYAEDDKVLWFITKRNGRRSAETATDNDGRFTIQGLAEGTYNVLVVHPDRGIAVLANVRQPNQGNPLEILVPPPTFLEGKIAGLNLHGQRSYAHLTGGSPTNRVAIEPRVVIAADGQFRVGPLLIPDAVRGVSPDEAKKNGWTLSVYQLIAARNFAATLLDLPIPLEPDKTTHFDIDLTRGPQLAGQVIGPNNQALPDVSVVAQLSSDPPQRYGAVTDAQGKYAISGLPEGKYLLKAERYAPRTGPG
jgi:hypothetical protein